ncbi:MAG: CpaF family protein [Actinobacteria bacterium]|nr:CpaF family protein [Actinomycetota bacterium]MCL6087163.1 CpaF family protein [Actinomycetota bacterium]
MQQDILENIYKKLAARIDIYNLNFADEKNKLKIIEKNLSEILDSEKTLLSAKDFKIVLNHIYEESFGYGPVSELMKNDEITEIMINNFDDIFIEKSGLIQKTNINFNSNMHVKNFIEKVLSPLGLRIDESCPMADARLKDGSRINVVINPISSNEIVVSIRKFKKKLKTVDDLVMEGTLNYEVSDFIKLCVKKKANIVISGATSTGKTTLLNIISNFIPANERIISIEDTFEISISLKNIVRLESRLPNIEGKGEITIRDLVRNSLRMRPDRIIVGEVRGIESIDVLQAMNTGHNGSMTTVHANSPVDLISRLETMLIMSGLNLNPSAARRIISSSINIIIHLERLNDGTRIVSRICELANESNVIGEKSEIIIRDIFNYCSIENKNKNSSNETCFKFSGHIPLFLKDSFLV